MVRSTLTNFTRHRSIFDKSRLIAEKMTIRYQDLEHIDTTIESLMYHIWRKTLARGLPSDIARQTPLLRQQTRVTSQLCKIFRPGADRSDLKTAKSGTTIFTQWNLK